MQDEIVKSLDVFWGQAKVGSYEKSQIGHWKKLALELNLGFAQLMRRLRGLCGEIQKVLPHMRELRDAGAVGYTTVL